MAETNPQTDALQAYQEAVDRVHIIRGEWERRGKPLLSQGSRGQEVAHPLWMMLNESEIVANKLRQPLLKHHRGPEPKAVVQAKIGRSPAATLRARMSAGSPHAS